MRRHRWRNSERGPEDIGGRERASRKCRDKWNYRDSGKWDGEGLRDWNADRYSDGLTHSLDLKQKSLSFLDH